MRTSSGKRITRRSVNAASTITAATAMAIVSILAAPFASDAGPPTAALRPIPPSLTENLPATAAAKPTAYEKRCRALIARQSANRGAETKRLHEAFDLQWTYMMDTYPEWATYTGFPGRNDRWTDLSLSSIATQERETSCYLKMARSFDRTALSAADRLNLDLFLLDAEQANEGLAFPEELLQLSQLGGVHKEIADVMAVAPMANERNYNDILARLRKAGPLIQQTVVLLKKGLAEKVTPPKIVLRDVPAQILAMITDDPFKSPLLSPFQEMPNTIPKERAESLRAEAARIYTGELKPILSEFLRFVNETYIPGARESVSWRDLPAGQQWYAYKARVSTTTGLSPEQIHKIGLQEVERIEREMSRAITESGFKGDRAAFVKFLRKDPRFYAKSADELLMEYRAIGKRADPELAKLFGRLPRLPYGVLPVPSFEEKSQTTAYYRSGSVASGRAGYFFANTYDLPSRPKWEMEALTLHEAVPGHHLQIALALEMDKFPEFRKHGGHTAFTEGWGLYAESLGYEMGFYKDSYSRFGQLTYDMWRALRLVVDTGIHSMGWSRDQAIEYMKKHLAKPEHDIVVEVDRYIVWAGQALAYKIGQLKIKELRERATRELGDRFDVRAFHDTVLGQGSIPLATLERIVTDWISARKAGTKTMTPHGPRSKAQ